MKIYNANLSPFASRCRIQAYAKNLAVEFVDPPGGLGSDEYRAIVATGKVPALEVDGRVLPESDTICEYLEDCFPDPPLRPADPWECGTMRLLSRIVDVYLVPPLSQLFGQVQPATRDAALVGAKLEEMDPRLDELETFVVADPFAAGATLTLADCTLFPFFFFATRLYPMLGAEDVFRDRSKLARWWGSIGSHDAVARVNEEMEAALIEYMAVEH